MLGENCAVIGACRGGFNIVDTFLQFVICSLVAFIVSKTQILFCIKTQVLLF